jgi:hypothetical protein
MADWAVLRLLEDGSVDLSVAALRTSLTTVLILVLAALFRKRFNSDCLARFNADL